MKDEKEDIKELINKKEKKSAGEYRKKADEHMDSLKDSYKIFGKTGIFAFAAVISIIIFCVSWFVSNRKVQVGLTPIRGAGNYFEIATKGNIDNMGRWDSNLSASAVQGDMERIDGQSFMVTSNSKDSILWAITDTSNMDNSVGQEGINPGSNGKLTFYIISKKSGTMTLTLNLTLNGLDGDMNLIPTDVQELLKGHILLFAGYNGISYRGWISKDVEPWTITLDDGTVGNPHTSTLSLGNNGSLTWTAEVQEGMAYPVSIYWIWPEVLGEYIFKAQTHIGNRPVLFPKDKTEEMDDTSETMPLNLFEKMCDVPSETNAVFNNYFKWASIYDSNKSDLRREFQSIVNVAALESMRRGNFNTITYGDMCYYYNVADQYLGENVPYISLMLEAQ